MLKGQSHEEMVALRKWTMWWEANQPTITIIAKANANGMKTRITLFDIKLHKDDP